jgi:hypothetical protein
MAASLTLTRARLPVAVALGAGGSASPLGNALTPDPKEAVTFAVPSALSFDLGAAIDIDTMFLGFGSGDLGNFSLYRTGDMTGAGAVLLGAGLAGAAATEKRRHVFFRFGLINTRYLQLVCWNAVATLGVFAFGKSVQPVWGHEWGAGRFVDDRSNKEALPSGGWGVDKHAVVPGWQFTVGDLTDTELDSLWDMAEEVGESSPVIVCEDPDAAGGRTLYSPIMSRANVSVGAMTEDGFHRVVSVAGGSWAATASGARPLHGDFVVHARVADVVGRTMVGIAATPGAAAYTVEVGKTGGGGFPAVRVGGADLVAGPPDKDGWIWRVGGTVFAGFGDTLAAAKAAPLHSFAGTATQYADLSLEAPGAAVTVRAWEPEPLNRRLHYGLFDKPEAYERLVPGASRWSFKVRGWI